MLNNICRLCCEADGDIPIFFPISGLSPSQKIIYLCNKTQINIEEDDDLPKLICAMCNDQLSNSYNFILQCEAADQKLRLKIEQFRPEDQSSKYDNYDKCSNALYEFKAESPKDCGQIQFSKLLLAGTQLEAQVHTRPANLSAIDTKPININKKHSTNLKIKKKKRHLFQNLGPFICQTCGKACKNNSSLLAHMRCHSDQRAFKCLHCDKTYKDPASLKRHNENNHEERSRNFVCDNCGKCFYSKKYLQVHVRTHTGETPYACKICPAQFNQASSLILHNRRHAGDKPFECKMCYKKFVCRTELNRHASVHSWEKKFKCMSCNVEFKSNLTYKAHVARHDNKQVFICDLCGRNFNAKSYLALHWKRNHSAKSGYCEVCSQHASNIEMHRIKHSGYRGTKCEYCPRTFLNEKGLKRHLAYKHNTQQYTCSEIGCEATFSLKAKLNYHVKKVHNPVIPFPCDKCSRGFYRQSDYVRHKKGTHKDIIVRLL